MNRIFSSYVLFFSFSPSLHLNSTHIFCIPYSHLTWLSFPPIRIWAILNSSDSHWLTRRGDEEGRGGKEGPNLNWIFSSHWLTDGSNWIPTEGRVGDIEDGCNGRMEWMKREGRKWLKTWTCLTLVLSSASLSTDNISIQRRIRRSVFTPLTTDQGHFTGRPSSFFDLNHGRGHTSDVH